MQRIFVFAAAVSLFACVASEPEPAVTLGQPAGDWQNATLPDPQCPPDDCGWGNTPVIKGNFFWMLNSKAGVANDEGVAIVQATLANGRAVTLIAVGDELRATELGNPHAVVATHAQLINTRILVSVKGEFHTIRIRNVWPSRPVDTYHDVPPEQLWVGAPLDVESYEFVYAPFDPAQNPLVTNPNEKPLCSQSMGRSGVAAVRANVFAGDRYDPATKTVTAVPDIYHSVDGTAWMNIACWMGAPYKMHHAGRTRAAAARLGYVLSTAESSAMLHMWTFAPCGGTSLTRPGTNIAIADARALFPGSTTYPLPSGDPKLVEALWGADGAVCLTTPRIPAGMTAEQQDDAVAKACEKRPPRCDTYLAAPWSHGAFFETGVL